jgi:hypothetical protein
VRHTAAGGGGRPTTSNKQKVVNALTHLALAGPHRACELAAALASIAASGAHYFLILLAAPEALTYRALYTYDPHPGGAPAARIHGHHGPACLTPAILTAVAVEAGDAAAEAGPGAGPPTPGALPDAARDAAATSHYVVDACFKYATAARCFAPIATRSVGLTTDAVTIRARHA